VNPRDVDAMAAVLAHVQGTQACDAKAIIRAALRRGEKSLTITDAHRKVPSRTEVPLPKSKESNLSRFEFLVPNATLRRVRSLAMNGASVASVMRGLIESGLALHEKSKKEGSRANG
jgi:hypothetical protein